MTANCFLVILGIFPLFFFLAQVHKISIISCLWYIIWLKLHIKLVRNAYAEGREKVFHTFMCLFHHSRLCHVKLWEMLVQRTGLWSAYTRASSTASLQELLLCKDVYKYPDICMKVTHSQAIKSKLSHQHLHISCEVRIRSQFKLYKAGIAL